MNVPLTSQKSEWPKVTIAIPTLNRVKYLRMALGSALMQTYPNIEVIVSNNASTDETAVYLASCTDPRLHVLHQPNRLPMTLSWNACVTVATGDFFLLLSDDDLLEPAAIHEMVAAYQANEAGQNSAGIVYCGGHIIDAEGNIRKTFAHSPAYESACDLVIAFFSGKRDLWLCAILFRTADISPGFSLAYSWAPDSDVWIRAVFNRNCAVFVPLELARYRVHDNATASLSMEVWQCELEQLGQLAIKCSEGSTNRDHTFPKRLKATVRKLIVRSIPARINASLAGEKLEALTLYGAYLPTMANFYGIRFLVMGLTSLLLPRNVKLWLRTMVRGKPS